MRTVASRGRTSRWGSRLLFLLASLVSPFDFVFLQFRVLWWLMGHSVSTAHPAWEPPGLLTASAPSLRIRSSGSLTKRFETSATLPRRQTMLMNFLCPQKLCGLGWGTGLGSTIMLVPSVQCPPVLGGMTGEIKHQGCSLWPPHLSSFPFLPPSFFPSISALGYSRF